MFKLPHMPVHMHNLYLESGMVNLEPQKKIQEVHGGNILPSIFFTQ